MAEGLASKGPDNPMSRSPQPGNPDFFACHRCGRTYNKSVILKSESACKACGQKVVVHGDLVCPECLEQDAQEKRTAEQDAQSGKAEPKGKKGA